MTPSFPPSHTSPRKNLRIGLTALLLPFCLAFAQAPVDPNNFLNPSNGKTDDKSECNGGCTSKEACANSALVNILLGQISPLGGGEAPTLQWHIQRPGPTAISPFQLRLRSAIQAPVRHMDQLANGDPAVLVFSGRNGGSVRVRFEEGASEASPTGRNDALGWRVVKRDAQGQATPENPAFYDLYQPDGSHSRFSASTLPGTFGTLVHQVSPTGRLWTLQDSGYEEVRGGEGELRQVRGPALLADILLVSDIEFHVNLYTTEQVGPDKINGVYPLIGTPNAYETHEFTLPDPANPARIHHIKNRDGETTIHEFTYQESTGAWSLETNPGQVDALRENVEKAWRNDMKELHV